MKSQNFYSIATGQWDAIATWSHTSGGAAITTAGDFPKAGSTVYILAGKTVTIGLNKNMSCATVEISGTSALTFTANTTTTSSLTCTGVFACGTTTKGTLNMDAFAKLKCEKLTIGAAASTILKRNGSNTSSFEFTGTGSGVIPTLTGDATVSNGTLVDFSEVIFNPTVTTTAVEIPLGFSARVISIKQGIVNFGTNYNYFFTDGSSLTMEGTSSLLIGGDKSVPLCGAYTLNGSSTINYTGNIQTVKAIPSPGYRNLALSGAGVKTLETSATPLKIQGNIEISTDVTLAIGANNNLVISGTYSDSGTGCVRGSRSSSLWYKGSYSESSMHFDQVTANGNALLNLTLGLSFANGGTDPEGTNTLNLNILNNLNIYGNLNLTSGHLVTTNILADNKVTLKSDINTTAFISEIVDPTLTGITGDVTVERFIPARSNVDGTNIGRAYRALSSSVTGGTIFSNWQENGSIASLTGSILGNILTTTDPSTPLVVGQHISGNLIPANTTITNIDNAGSNEYEISTVQNVASRSMVAYTSIATATVTARFTGSITGNELDVTGFTLGAGTLAVGQKILGGTLANTVITAFVSGTGDTGTYTIGLEIPSETIHYNGAPAGFGTHITGVASTDAQLGQYDTATGLDFTRSGKPSMFTYDNGWNPVINTKTENLTAGSPYLITIRGDRTIDLASNTSTPTNTILRSTGEIIAGPLEVLGLDTTTNNFNFVGNPYQAPVDLSLIYADNTRWADLGTSYTVFDSKINTKGGYVTFDFEVGSNEIVTIDPTLDPQSSVMDATLEPNQAFFVRTSGATPTLVFNEADKNVASNDYVPMFRKAKSTNSLIKGSVFNAASNKGLDGFILAFSDTYNNDIIAEDSKKISNADENFSIKNGANDLVIDKRNNPSENDVIALNLTQQRLSDYVLKFEVSNFDAKDAYLVDAYTKKETALKNNQINSYAFKVDATPESSAADRFSIVFKAATSLSINSNSIKELAVYPNPVVDNKFTVRTNHDLSGKKATLSIVNTLGQKVYSTNGTFSTDGSIAVKPTNVLNKGIYFLKVAVDGKEETKKLIIK